MSREILHGEEVFPRVRFYPRTGNYELSLHAKGEEGKKFAWIGEFRTREEAEKAKKTILLGDAGYEIK